MEWISRFGVPEKVTSDCGTNFQSNLFSSLAKFLGAKQTRTTAYHPKSNGALERFHIHLKSVLIFLKTGWTLFRWCYSASERVLKYTPSLTEDYVQYLQTLLEDIHEFSRCRVNIATEKMKTSLRPFLLAISGAYRTTSTAAIQVILGIPLQREARSTDLYRLKLPVSTNFGDIDPSEIKEKATGWSAHPSEHRSPTQISLDDGGNISTGFRIYTDGSETESKLLHSHPHIRVSWIKARATKKTDWLRRQQKRKNFLKHLSSYQNLSSEHSYVRRWWPLVKCLGIMEKLRGSFITSSPKLVCSQSTGHATKFYFSQDMGLSLRFSKDLTLPKPHCVLVGEFTHQSIMLCLSFHNLLPCSTTQPTTSASLVPQRSQQFDVKKEDP
ncbi:hypothetical protein AVEN_212575-1 [Araneus ventricosus]|uniref:Integrase catalytic domain-containing protein n=1 Tax=Araneus ventricosus TaxID=182803 RepID=A0A4Y2LS79_ARAVE|nr:hypothetical protein AVEN_212575-1 [Araneus ventricosus]